MADIRFESARAKEELRCAKQLAREKILKKAKSDFERAEKRKERRKHHGDDKWLLPSVNCRIKNDETSAEVKRKKSHKKMKKHSSSEKRDKSDEEVSSDSSTEWVESSLPAKSTPEKSVEQSLKRDDWMLSSDFAGRTFTRKQLMDKEPKKDTDKLNLDNPGQHERELNPYWRDGGKGLPPEKDPRASSPPKDVCVGDGGLAWLERAYRRIHEQAEEEGRSVEDIAAERWGSLKKLEETMASARRKAGVDSSSRRWQEKDRSRWRRHDKAQSSKDGSARSLENRAFSKPSDDDAYGESSSSARGVARDRNSVPKWKRPDRSKEAEKETRKPSVEKIIPQEVPKDAAPQVPMPSKNAESPAVAKLMTDEDMNKLAAKILKAELMGDEANVLKLKTQMEEARNIRAFGTKQDAGMAAAKVVRETPVLTSTDRKGFTKPFASYREQDPYGGRSGKRKNKNAETHDTSGMRIRYFADDDKYSLHQMFEREKTSTADDENALFSQMAGRAFVSNDTDFDIDDTLVNKASNSKLEAKLYQQERDRAVKVHSKMADVLDRCFFCFENSKVQKHLIVALGSKVYLRLPHHCSLVDGHCQLIPMRHVVASTHLDEDVWEEMQNFKKSLETMFSAMNKDVLFLETSMHRRSFPHMVLECIPLPADVGFMAPMYFKKAILESETEWAQNKKLVDLKGKDVRKAVPKELPYFSVNFGNKDQGFAHVIEDEQSFSKTFAQEIVAGILDLEPQNWRKPPIENFDRQREKVLKFYEFWKPYDWTQDIS